jgi:type I restriction enzyme R subunit
MSFNENTRVKIPAILHLVRLGYTYISLKNAVREEQTNIFTNLFKESILRINDGIEADEVNRLLEDVSLLLDNEDLGHAFYDKLTSKSGTRLIDFENFDNNSFHVVTELTYKNGDEEFRPDIILLINGMPLAFIEVKKPNNRDGVLAERNRIYTRFQNKKFRKFVNITQLMVFSNNMEYDPDDIEPIQGAFYASPSYFKPLFNYFREEDEFDFNTLLLPEHDETENFVLKDNNLISIKHSPEFITNKEPSTPTNRISNSLFSRDRLQFVLQYALAYVKETKGIEKHIMRYPQIFATKEIEKTIEKDIKKGIIWHTQGSGKTALTYYNVQHLTDHFQKQNIIPKFYFIVDRLDLLLQAKKEFTARGLVVHTVNSKEEFIKDIKNTSAIHNLSGKREITVVNIQKFSEDAAVVTQKDYDIAIQRVYFLDEVHRSYNPTGSFLANLTNSDKNAIIIGLTGTPLITSNLYSTAIFGKYIHKYYYNSSIADGYTLRLIREEIETNYRMVLEEALREIEVLQGDLNKKEIYSHHKFVEPMLDYIITDFEKTRFTIDDASIGGMVVCDSSDQAKMMYEVFNNKYTTPSSNKLGMVAEERESYGDTKNEAYKVKTAALILHDAGTKEERKQQVDDFKDGKIDFLFVYNMLLTGFDAKRLKKLYLGRVIKKHNLLQTLTRVNRPYKEFRYGYVVDFADISKEFDATNKAYFDELQSELGSEMEHYSNLFKSKEEIEMEIRDIKEALFHFDTKNAELFSQQISQIKDRTQVLEIVKALGNARSLYNLIRFFGHFDLLEKIDFKKLNQLYSEASNHLALLNTKEAIESNVDTTNLLNVALENVLFLFRKVSEAEMILADQLKDTLRKTREALNSNFDKNDPEFVTLYDELKRLFQKKNLDEITQEEMTQNIGSLRLIYDKVGELNRKNNLLKAKYDNDAKYARIHKRIKENGGVTARESELFEALRDIKTEADLQVLLNTKLMQNESYFEAQMIRLVIDQFKNKNKINLDAPASKYINQLVVKEYTNEFYGRTY